MRRRHRLGAAWIILGVALLYGCAHSIQPQGPETRLLDQEWQIQSSALTRAEGGEISRPGLDTAGWVPATVPSTVLAALVRNGRVEDPFAARNLETMSKEPFAVPWWYRHEFTLSAVPADGRLIFEGINYRANIWLNGERIATRDDIVGSFRVFELDVTPHLRTGVNVLAAEVIPPQKGDPTIGFVDWNPSAPDNYLGLWREVKLRMTPGVSLDDVWVRGDVDPANLDEGRISIRAKLSNRTERPVRAVVQGRIGPGPAISVSREFALGPNEEREVQLGPDQFPQLVLTSPRLWWPNNLGDPNLYSLQLDVLVNGNLSDRSQTAFGIRHIADYINEQGHRGYAINGKPVLIRGGGWVDDVLLIEDPRRLEDQILYVKHMNLNTIRLEGFWGNTHRLFDLADQHGIMVWVGWSCQWEWEDYLGQPVDETYGGIDTPEEMELITRSWRDQVMRLRNHPSVIVWNLASDMLPRPELERRFLAQLSEIDPSRPSLGACSTRTSEVTGPTAVKMNGPYEWVPPNYWYEERAPGGAFGFNTETGPGAQPPVAESLRRMLPKESWWPIDDMWSYHSARNEFKNLDRYVAALDARYGPARNLDEFSLKAQIVNYEGMRAMFESFSLRRPVATGIIQWMLNSAWPKVFWQLYDYYLVPTGAFYGARDASRPIHIALDHGTNRIVAVNDTDGPLRANAIVRTFDTRSRLLAEQRLPLEAGPGTRTEVLPLPPQGEGQFRFLDARIEGQGGDLLDANFYWLPAAPDVLDWEKGQWFYTPVARYADLTAVNTLPPAALQVEHRFVPVEGGTAVDIALHNPGPHLAFFVELSVAGKESGELAAPIFWDSNYVSLIPGETRRLRATFPSHALNDEPVLRYRGMNVEGATR